MSKKMIGKATLKFDGINTIIDIIDQDNKHKETIKFASVHLGWLLSGNKIQVIIEQDDNWQS